jgi:hypothetical protein
MSKAYQKNNNVIMVADIDCVAAIEYETSYEANGTYKDAFGHIWTTFVYSDVLEEIIADYQRGDFHVTVPGFVEYYNNYMAQHDEYAAHFDDDSYGFSSTDE